MPAQPEIDWVSFEAPQYGVWVEIEGEMLSQDFLDMALSHIEKLIRGKIDPLSLQPWRMFGDVPLMMVPLGDELMVYAVEDRSARGETSLKITSMFAGARSRGYYGLEGIWDGTDNSLWDDVVEKRCRLWFS